MQSGQNAAGNRINARRFLAKTLCIELYFGIGISAVSEGRRRVSRCFIIGLKMKERGAVQDRAFSGFESE
jgi:hypothetical protein